MAIHGAEGALARVRCLVALGARVQAFPPDHCETSMHWAANRGYTEVLDTLLRAGGDSVLGVFDDFPFTPLHHAAFKGHVHAVRFLLDAGSDVNSVDDENIGDTALSLAVQEGWPDVVELLLARGADPTIPGFMRLTPLDHALDPEPESRTPAQRRIVELLQHHTNRNRDESPDR
nr:ankyrin repeat domain-containing protein [Pyxidicoccus fallax]